MLASGIRILAFPAIDKLVARLPQRRIAQRNEHRGRTKRRHSDRAEQQLANCRSTAASVPESDKPLPDN